MNKLAIKDVLSALSNIKKMDVEMGGHYNAEYYAKQFKPLLDASYSIEDVSSYVAIKLQNYIIENENKNENE